MAAIPRRLYAYIERRLYAEPVGEVCSAAQAIREARTDATALPSPGQERIGGRSSAPGSRVQHGVERLILAEDNLHTALAWAQIRVTLGEIFAGTREGEIAAAIYEQGRTSQDVAQALGVDRQTIRRCRDTYVGHAALLAAEAGLIRLKEHIDVDREGET